jgi:hypothetical protein
MSRASIATALAEHSPTLRPTWEATAGGLIDAIVAMWQAPIHDTA